MLTRDFHYDLPAELIAQVPLEPRDACRMLCLSKDSGELTDSFFSQITRHLQPQDLLVFNNTRVIPARLFGTKETGGKVEILLERLLDEQHCLAHIKASQSPQPGANIAIAGIAANVKVLGRSGQHYTLAVDEGHSLDAILQAAGHMPLPPYISRPDTDADVQRYQTVYARHAGAVAAPTAGLHFTQDLLAEIETQVCQTAYVTLHVGTGTFQPVRVADVREHTMHSEWFELNEQAAMAIEQTRKKGGRIIAVGTTSLRCVESVALPGGQVQAKQAETDIFIYPGYEFKLVDGLITNFHLPQSTLLMLVSALAGKESVMQAYQYAIEQKYRFFSYGDAMFIY